MASDHKRHGHKRFESFGFRGIPQESGARLVVDAGGRDVLHHHRLAPVRCPSGVAMPFSDEVAVQKGDVVVAETHRRSEPEATAGPGEEDARGGRTGDVARLRGDDAQQVVKRRLECGGPPHPQQPVDLLLVPTGHLGVAV